MGPANRNTSSFQDLERARLVIMSYANRLTHMGPVGSGQATKACNQLINFVGVAAVAEAIQLGTGFGIDIEKLPEALSGGFLTLPSFGNTPAERRRARRGASPFWCRPCWLFMNATPILHGAAASEPCRISGEAIETTLALRIPHPDAFVARQNHTERLVVVGAASARA